MSILVSINCITYNQDKYIGQAIDGFLAQQTDFDFEVLIHDDASTDATANIIRRYSEAYPGLIKPCLQSENQHSRGIKVGIAFNLPRAQGKYIAFCEGDDYWTDPGKLQKQIDYLEAHPECSLCCHAVAMVTREGKTTSEVVRPYKKNGQVPTEDLIAGGGQFLGSSSIVYRRVLMNDPPDFYLRAPVGDFPLVLYLATRGSVYYLDEVMSAYRQGVPNSWTAKTKASPSRQYQLRNGLIEMLDAFNEYTGYQYAASVKKRRTKYELMSIINRGNIEASKEDKYQEYYDKLGLYLVILIYINKYFPWLFQKMRKYYGFIMTKLDK